MVQSVEQIVLSVYECVNEPINGRLMNWTTVIAGRRCRNVLGKDDEEEVRGRECKKRLIEFGHALLPTVRGSNSLHEVVVRQWQENYYIIHGCCVVASRIYHQVSNFKIYDC